MPPVAAQGDDQGDLVAARKGTIDSILEKRQTAPVSEDDDSVDETGSASEKVTRPGPVLGQPLDIAPEEQIKAYSDVYGQPPPEVELFERRIAAVEEEIRKLPREQKGSLQRALDHNPMLVTSSQHAKLMINDENFDAPRVAKKLVRYWEHREAMLGDLAFSDGVFTQPKYSDYLKYYYKCEKVVSDPDADEDDRHTASEYIRCVHEAKLAAMEKIIESVPIEDKAAMMEAWKRSPEQFASDEHMLSFLRSEEFVEGKATERMLRYWKAKQVFFGSDTFHRRISLGDMKNHVFELGQVGVNRIMPGTDAHGRVIVVLFLRDLVKEGWTEEGFARYVWYVLQTAMERKECQKNGIVLFGDCRSLTREEYEKIACYRQIIKMITLKCFPVTIKAAHVFYGSDVWWQRLFATAFATIAGIITNRAVIHIGSNEENMSALTNKFGISTDIVPVEMGGEVELDSWTKWLEERKSKGL